MEDMMEQHLIDSTNHIMAEPQANEPLPEIFYNIDNWVKSTKILCWNCARLFSDIPVFVPKSIEPDLDTGKFQISVEGCFCSFNCAISYINLYYPLLCNQIEKKNMLELLFREFYGFRAKVIEPAPNKFELIQFGGNKTPREYHIELRELQKLSGLYL